MNAAKSKVIPIKSASLRAQLKASLRLVTKRGRRAVIGRVVRKAAP